MSYLGVKFNNTIRKIAGMAIMDVAFSNTSINGVQNKVIKAKFDEIEDSIAQSYSNVDVYVTGDGVSTYSSKLDSLFALIDTSKLTANSKFVMNIPNVFKGSSLICFTNSLISTHFVTSGHVNEYSIQTSASTLKRFTFNGASLIDNSALAVPDGAILGIIY